MINIYSKVFPLSRTSHSNPDAILRMIANLITHTNRYVENGEWILLGVRNTFKTVSHCFLNSWVLGKVLVVKPSLLFDLGKITSHRQSYPTDCNLLRLHNQRSFRCNGYGVSYALKLKISHFVIQCLVLHHSNFMRTRPVLQSISSAEDGQMPSII